MSFFLVFLNRKSKFFSKSKCVFLIRTCLPWYFHIFNFFSLILNNYRWNLTLSISKNVCNSGCKRRHSILYTLTDMWMYILHLNQGIKVWDRSSIVICYENGFLKRRCVQKHVNEGVYQPKRDLKFELRNE